MNSRRKFLIRGSMASTALLIAKPFTTFANAVAPVTGFTINDNKLVFVHTGNYKGTNQQQTMKHIARLKSNTGNLVLLHAGNPFEGNGAALNYDASMNVDNNFSLATNDHKIIYKGNIKIGVISATEDETDPIKKINTVSACAASRAGARWARRSRPSSIRSAARGSTRSGSRNSRASRPNPRSRSTSIS